MLDDIYESKREFILRHNKRPRYILISEKFKEDILDRIRADTPGFAFYYDPSDIMNTRLFGMSVRFTDSIKGYNIFNDDMITNNEQQIFHDEFMEYCRNNTKSYNQSKIDSIYENDSYVQIKRSELFEEIASFLLASSHMSDEGCLPYPSFQNLSHHLSHNLSEKFGFTKDMSGTSRMIYDRLYKEYLEEEDSQ